MTAGSPFRSSRSLQRPCRDHRSEIRSLIDQAPDGRRARRGTGLMRWRPGSGAGSGSSLTLLEIAGRGFEAIPRQSRDASPSSLQSKTGRSAGAPGKWASGAPGRGHAPPWSRRVLLARPVGQRLPEAFFRQARAVQRRGVEEADSELPGGVDRLEGHVGRDGWVEAAERSGSQTEAQCHMIVL
jgi:hypothetical protein